MENQNKGMNLFQRMSAITTELSSVAKNLNVGDGAVSYKAVGEGDVLKAVKPLEAKYGVYSYPSNRRIVSQEIIETQRYDKFSKQMITKKQVFLRVETIYSFVNIDNPTEQINMITYGDGFDPQDKAPGKAVTYSDKYALLKAYKIVTGDDPDQNLSEEVYKAYEEFAQAEPVNAAAAKPVRQAPKKDVPVFDSFTPLTDIGYQQAICLDKKWQNLACQRFKVSSVVELSMEQLNYILTKLDEARSNESNK